MEISGKRKRIKRRRKSAVGALVTGRKRSRRRSISGSGKLTSGIIEDLALVAGAVAGVIIDHVADQKAPDMNKKILQGSKLAAGFAGKRFIKNPMLANLSAGLMVQSAVELARPLSTSVTGIITGEEPDDTIVVQLSGDDYVIEGEDEDPLTIQGEDNLTIQGDDEDLTII